MSVDRWRFTTLAHAGRTWLGPVSDAAADAILEGLDRPPARVLDVGCGKGAMLARVLRRSGGTGVGVEPNPAFAADARAAMAGLAPAASFGLHACDLSEAALLEASFDLTVCTGASHAFGTTEQAVAGLARLTARHGWVLLGEGYWRRRPEPEYAALLGGEDALTDHGGNARLGRHHGLACVRARESTAQEWDAYEGAYAAAMRAWCEAHPDDPDATPFRARIDSWNAAYHRWGRDTLGFGLYLFRRVS